MKKFNDYNYKGPKTNEFPDYKKIKRLANR